MKKIKKISWRKEEIKVTILVATIALLGCLIMFIYQSNQKAGNQGSSKSVLTVNDTKQENRTSVQTKREWGSPVQGFRLSIRPQKEQFSIGERLKIIVCLESSIRPLATFSARKYEVIVKNGRNKIAQKLLTENEPRLIPTTPKMIESGITNEHGIEVNKIYDMTTTDQYFITVKFEVPRLKGQGFSKIISNTIKLEFRSFEN